MREEKRGKEDLMDRKIVVVNPFLTEEMKKKVADTAAAGGFSVYFYANDEEAREEIREAEAAAGYGTNLTKEGVNLRWFHSMSAGIDAYQLPGAIANPDLILTHSVGAYGVTLSEHTLMTILMVLRREMAYADEVRRHVWLKRMPVRGIIGSRVTILGTGDIGREIAARLRSFSPQSITGVNRSGHCMLQSAFDRVVKRDALEQVLRETDILVMALPGGQETYHYIGERELALLPDDAVVVNVGRGACLDTAALEKALRAGKLWGAALDVFETEPLPADSGLWDCPRLLITPHIAGGPTLRYTLQKIIDQFCENLEKYPEGKLCN